MSVVSFGYGRDTDVLGAVVAFGFGRRLIQPAYVPIRFDNQVAPEVRTQEVLCERDE